MQLILKKLFPHLKSAFDPIPTGLYYFISEEPLLFSLLIKLLSSFIKYIERYIHGNIVILIYNVYM